MTQLSNQIRDVYVRPLLLPSHERAQCVFP